MTWTTSTLLAVLAAAVQTGEVPATVHETVPVDSVSFVLQDANDFCFEETNADTDSSVLVDFNTKRGAGELLVRKSGTDIDYSLTNPVQKVERWREAGVEKIDFSLAGRSGDNQYQGSLTVLRRPGYEDTMELRMSRNGKAIAYNCASDLVKSQPKL